MGDQEEAPGSWLQIGAVPAVAAIWGVNQWREDLSVCLSVSVSFSLTVYNSTYQIKKKNGSAKE